MFALSLLAGCANAPHAPIALPSAGADPRTVVSVYLEALQAGDCQTASQLTTASFATNGELCGHFGVRSYTAPSQPGFPGNGEAIVSTVLTFTHPDASLNHGKSVWFYVLRYQAADGQWRLVSGGTGL